jgi:hypothetical protein
MPKILYTYLISFTSQGPRGTNFGRAVRQVDTKLNSLTRIEAVEAHLRAGEKVQVLGITGLVLLKRRFGFLPNPIFLAASTDQTTTA